MAVIYNSPLLFQIDKITIEKSNLGTVVEYF